MRILRLAGRRKPSAKPLTSDRVGLAVQETLENIEGMQEKTAPEIDRVKAVWKYRVDSEDDSLRALQPDGPDLPAKLAA